MATNILGKDNATAKIYNDILCKINKCLGFWYPIKVVLTTGIFQKL